MQEIFKIDEIVFIAPHRWLVKVRAWETFGIGDTLYAAVGRSYKTVIENDRAEGILLDPGVISYDRPFTVVSISTYGLNMDTLDRGLTGEAILEGEGSDILKEKTILVKME